MTSVITDAMRGLISVESEPYVLEIEKGDIIRYGTATRNSIPIYTDELAARHGRYGALIAPPTFLIVMRVLETAALAKIGLQLPYEDSVDGGSEWNYYEPIRVGDRITAVAKYVDFYERDGRFGHMVLAGIEITYRNQFDEVVVRQRDTRIRYERSV